MGIFVRTGTAPEIVARLERAVLEAMEDPAVRGTFDRLGFEASPLSADRFADLLPREVESWARIIQDVGVPLQ